MCRLACCRAQVASGRQRTESCLNRGFIHLLHLGHLVWEHAGRCAVAHLLVCALRCVIGDADDFDIPVRTHAVWSISESREHNSDGTGRADS